MKTIANIVNILSIFIILQGCNTLYNTTVVNIEILEPAQVYMAPNYKNAAIRYNNYNVGFNPYFSAYFDGYKAFTDTTSTDSIASRIYFDSFANQLSAALFFDTVVQIQPADFLHVEITDTIQKDFTTSKDSMQSDTLYNPEQYVKYFSRIIANYPVQKNTINEKKMMHPELGLYSPEELDAIQDSTGADILFSLDFYGSLDNISVLNNYVAIESIYILSVWNMYDLAEGRLLNIRAKIDSVMWNETGASSKEALKKLPPRKDAIFNAADISGYKFANFLVPHWITVQRMYYSSGHVNLAETDKLVQENKWMEAAMIWKNHTTNPNKNIAAKCKFNMALVCEINGDFDAALDWAIQSFRELGAENQMHFFNCQQYIKILSQRKLDIKEIDRQLDRARL